jgi:hypothetical protein
MKTQNHTPGPWYALGDYISSKAGGEIVCSTKRTTDANAALIASAPELLAECQRSHFEICQQILNGDQFTPEMLTSWANGLRAAIARAEGRAE